MCGRNNQDSLPRAGVWRLLVSVAEQGLRIDQFLTQTLDHLSRGQWRKVIELGGVHYNGRRTRRCGTLLQTNDRLEVYLDGRTLTPYRLADDEFVYRDQYLVALNKPCGVETQPTHARFVGTLYEAMSTWLRAQAGNRRRDPELGMIQRLDRDTTGLLIFSIHQRAHKPLTQAFTQRQAKKIYLAIVQGVPEARGEFRSLLARSRKGNLVKSVSAGGKEAITRYRLLASSDSCSLVQVEPLTGRSHQIRVHFAEAGHPLLGDVRYGGTDRVGDMRIVRQQLHAWQLELSHPLSGEPLQLQAPLAADMLELFDLFGWEPNCNPCTVICSTNKCS